MIAVYGFVGFLVLCVLNLFFMVLVHNSKKYEKMVNAFRSKESIGQSIFDFAIVNMYIHGFYSIKSFVGSGSDKLDRTLSHPIHWIYKYTAFCFILYTVVFLYVGVTYFNM
ncbi:hypothetical protein DBR09_18335 [Aeromonas sp. HMWF016]|nr:hypothetical protein DBR09_18335 [Aeromonas sp. HMWF016]